MKNINTIEVKFMAPTNTRGAKIKITSLRFNSSIIINYDYTMSNIYDMAAVYLVSQGITSDFVSEGKNCYYIHSLIFADIK